MTVDRLEGLPNESGFYHGQIIKWATDVCHRRVLFAGETMETGALLAKAIGAWSVETAGLEDANWTWNFNEKAPHLLQLADQFDLVISQSILEHILNPYGFMDQLAALTVPGGHLITHTHPPGFPIHRGWDGEKIKYLDTLRFHPDWFEGIAEPFDLEVVESAVEGAHLFFLYRKATQHAAHRDPRCAPRLDFHWPDCVCAAAVPTGPLPHATPIHRCRRYLVSPLYLANEGKGLWPARDPTHPDTGVRGDPILEDKPRAAVRDVNRAVSIEGRC